MNTPLTLTTIHRRATPAASRLGERTARLAAVTTSRHTYGGVAYLLLAAPLGLAYFAALATGFALATVLTPFLVGVPLLAALLAATWRLTSFERHLAAARLGTTATAVPAPAWPGLRAALRDARARERFLTELADPATTRGLAYLALRLPLGLIALAATAAAAATPALLLIAPLADPLAAGDALPAGWEGAVNAGPALAPIAAVLALHATTALAGIVAAFADFMLAPIPAPSEPARESLTPLFPAGQSRANSAATSRGPLRNRPAA